MQLSAPFNPRSVQPASADGGGGQLPIGEWPCVIYGHDIKATQNDSNSGMLILDLRITQGPHAGQTGKWRLGIYHSNPQTKDIAYKQLASLCYNVGWLQDLVEVSVLHDKQFIAVIQPQTGEDAQKKGYTQVQGTKDMNGNDPGKQQPAQQPQNGGAPPGNWNPGAGTQQPQGGAPQGGGQWAQGGGAPQTQQPQGGGQWAGGGGQQPQTQQPQTQQPQGGGQQWNPGAQQQPAAAGAAPWRT